MELATPRRESIAEAASVAVARKQIGRDAGDVLQLRHPVLPQQVVVEHRVRVLKPETVDAEFGLHSERRHLGPRLGGGEIPTGKGGDRSGGENQNGAMKNESTKQHVDKKGTRIGMKPSPEASRTSRSRAVDE
jgi:hypothetical protein